MQPEYKTSKMRCGGSWYRHPEIDPASPRFVPLSYTGTAAGGGEPSKEEHVLVHLQAAGGQGGPGVGTQLRAGLP